MTLAEMQFVLPDLIPASAEIFLLTMACVIMMVDLFVKDKKRTLTFALTLITLVGTGVATFGTMTGEIIYTFSNMYVDDLMGSVLKLFLYFTVIVVLLYSRGYMLDRPQIVRAEFYTLSLFATLGMMVMISANHFLTVYIGIELLSLALYAMVALNRDSVTATEAAMKYFVLGALASGLLLYGMSMIYGATGTLEITGVAERLYAGQVNRTILVFGLVFLVSGIAFKLGVVPFHMWIPDVYHGAPTAVTLFIASAPKLAAFAIVMRMLVNGLIVMAQDWQLMLIILAVLSMAIGNLAAIAQTNLKRMLAYSTISQMGFVLLGFVAGVINGETTLAANAYSSAMFYMVSYVLTTLAAFGVIMLLARQGFESEEITDLAGLNQRSPLYAGVMAICLFSMAGIPPMVGFYAKLSVLQSLLASGQGFYLGLAIFAVIMSLIGAFYYLRVVKVMYFDEPVTATTVSASLDVRLVLSTNGLLVLLLGIFPGALMALCADSIVRMLAV
jgi:NADH-quinone oxidoreductase subunit N